jgi:hypothetical protein
MSLQGSYEVIISALGISIQGSSGVLQASQGIDPVDTTVPAAKAVTDWVKTDANTAGCNLPAGHGWTDGSFDVFWDGGYRYGVPGTIATNALTLDGGAGDDFPATGDETVVVCPQTPLDLTFDGDNLVLIGAISTRAGLLLFRDSGGVLIGQPVELIANVPWGWATGRGTNPVSGNAVASGSISNSSTAGTAGFKLTGLQYAVQ